MKKYFNEKSITILIIISIFGFPLLEFIGMFFKQKFFLQEEFLSLIGILGFICTGAYIINGFKKKKNKKIVLSDIFLITSIFFCIISIIFSKVISISLKGHKGYSETPLQVLGYFTLFFMCTNITQEKNKKIILNAFLTLGILETIVAFLQNFSMWPIDSMLDSKWHVKDHLAFGFTQHCNFFAPIAIIFTALFSMKYLYSNTKKEKYFCLICSILCCFSILFTYTRIGWVGIIAILFGIAFLEIFLCKKHKEFFKIHLIRFIILFISFLICFLAAGLPSGQIKKDVAASKQEIAELKTSNVDNFATKRGSIWKAGLSALIKYPLTGVGFDIYDYSTFIYNGKTVKQNKAHNEYLHIAVTQGIFSGLNYLAFAFYCCYFPFREILKSDTEFGKSNLTKMFLVALFAYFVQALFNSSVTNVAIYKWILMGLVLPRAYQFNLKDTKYVK